MIRRWALALVLCLLAGGALADQAQMGTYRGAANRAGIAAFETWLGRPIPRALDFLFFTNWGDCSTGNSPCSLGGWAIGEWAKQSRAMSFGLPMTVQGTPLADVAAGLHDDAYLWIAQRLVAKGLGGATLRVGWEFNGGWYPWAAAGKTTAFKNAWIRIVTVMRSVPGQSFKFDWNPGLGYLGFPAEQAYPGDAYVDYIGMDVYDAYYGADYKTASPQTRWNSYLTQDHGLNWLATFAAAHGKPISFPEWGTGSKPDGHGATDSAYFVQQMMAWIASHNVAYHNPWDYAAPDYNGRFSDGSQPNVAAALMQAYLAGPASPQQPLDTPVDPDMAELANLRQQLPALQAQVTALTDQGATCSANLLAVTGARDAIAAAQVALQTQVDAVKAARDAATAAGAANDNAAAALKAAVGGL